MNEAEQWAAQYNAERDAYDAAWDAWHPLSLIVDGVPAYGGQVDDDDWTVRMIDAEADTGSRYTVVATRLGLGGTLVGGGTLVSVLHPWQAAYPMAESGYLHPSYVAEKLSGGERRRAACDLAGLVRTICLALNRPAERMD